MVNVVLVEPEIPQNCGNIARTCVLTGSRLHLVGPLGFDISEAAVRRNMKRCGLDYWPRLDVTYYDDLDDFFRRQDPKELWLATTKAPCRYDRAAYQDGCWILFGKESAGLPGTAGGPPGPVRPHPHAAGRAQPQPLQQRCRHGVRGPAAVGLSRSAGRGGDGRGRTLDL